MDTPKNNNQPTGQGFSTTGLRIMESMPESQDGCSDLPSDSMAAYEKPGYKLMHYVEGFIKTDMCRVPLLKTYLDKVDTIANGLVRCGINRHKYRVVPGLYAVGNPTKESEVLVTANFKLTIDHLRKAVSGINFWILVLDTKGSMSGAQPGKAPFQRRHWYGRLKNRNWAGSLVTDVSLFRNWAQQVFPQKPSRSNPVLRWFTAR